MKHLVNKLNDIQRPVIFILIGLPGSGKSTWREKLLEITEKSFITVSLDDHLDRIAKDKNLTYSQVYKDHVGEATFLMKEDSKNAINNRNNIIWDQTNMSAKKRRGIIKSLPKDYYKIAVDFSVNPYVLKERLIERGQKTGKFIPDSVIVDMGKSYTAPTKEEGFDEIVRIST